MKALHKKNIIGISLNTTSAQKTFLLGEPFSSNNLLVNINYSDTTNIATEIFNVNYNNYNANSAGNYNIIVNFKEFSASYSVTVSNISYPKLHEEPYLNSLMQNIYSKVRTSYSIGFISVLNNEYAAFALSAFNNSNNPYYFYLLNSAELQNSPTALTSAIYNKSNASLEKFNEYFNTSYTKNEVYLLAQQYITALNNTTNYESFLNNHVAYKEAVENITNYNPFIHVTYNRLSALKEYFFAPYNYNLYESKQVSYDVAKNEITINATFAINNNTMTVTFVINATTKLLKSLSTPYDVAITYFNFG